MSSAWSFYLDEEQPPELRCSSCESSLMFDAALDTWVCITCQEEAAKEQEEFDRFVEDYWRDAL